MTDEHSPKHGISPSLWILLGGGLVLGIVMAILTIDWRQPAAPSSNSSSGLFSVADPVAVGQPAPGFSADTPDGNTINLDDLRGSPVALNFWATWCVPCREEMPAMQSAAERYADQGLIIMGLNAGEPATQVEAYIDILGLTFPTVIDLDGSIAAQYGVYAFPTTIWIDAEGVIRVRHIGPLTQEDIERYVAELLEP
ncbi:MAG: redoxin domain-containing protein [Anaerolineae bacterium]|nr:redoxin domain-containing protein [Anaerolineae bacterium]